MKVKVLFFAKARELVETSGIDLELDEGADTTKLTDLLKEKFPKLIEILPRIALSLNQEYLDESGAALKEGDEVALIPPISGG
mmetsp:Transcript_4109/g.4703  ORF Transcript_4109/g.4703 Transcript_4109/m.4703 type:complete len:83 (+) Transcript_4109:374-622(+)